MSLAAWTPGSGPAYRSGAASLGPARATSQPDARRQRRPPRGLVASAPEDPVEDLARPLLVGEGPADQQQDHEIDRAGTGGVEVSQLLADLAVDLEARDRRSHESELEERALRGGVRSHARRDRALGLLPTDDDRVRTR